MLKVVGKPDHQSAVSAKRQRTAVVSARRGVSYELVDTYSGFKEPPLGENLQLCGSMSLPVVKLMVSTRSLVGLGACVAHPK